MSTDPHDGYVCPAPALQAENESLHRKLEALQEAGITTVSKAQSRFINGYASCVYCHRWVESDRYPTHMDICPIPRLGEALLRSVRWFGGSDE